MARSHRQRRLGTVSTALGVLAVVGGVACVSAAAKYQAPTHTETLRNEAGFAEVAALEALARSRSVADQAKLSAAEDRCVKLDRLMLPEAIASGDEARVHLRRHELVCELLSSSRCYWPLSDRCVVEDPPTALDLARQSVAAAREAVAAGGSCADRDALVRALVCAADLLCRLGQDGTSYLPEAEQLAAEAVAQSQMAGRYQSEGYARSAYARCLAALGDDGGAAAEYEAAIERLRAIAWGETLSLVPDREPWEQDLLTIALRGCADCYERLGRTDEANACRGEAAKRDAQLVALEADPDLATQVQIRGCDQEWARREVARAERSGKRDELARVLGVWAQENQASSMGGGPNGLAEARGDALRAYRLNGELYFSTVDPRFLARQALNLASAAGAEYGLIHHKRGTAEEAVRFATWGASLARKAGDPMAEARSERAMAGVLHWDGRLGESAEHYGRALERCRAAGDATPRDRVFRLGLLCSVGERLAGQGEGADSLALLSEALEVADSLRAGPLPTMDAYQHRRMTAAIWAGLAEQAEQYGSLDLAVANWDRAIGIEWENGWQPWWEARRASVCRRMAERTGDESLTREADWRFAMAEAGAQTYDDDHNRMYVHSILAREALRQHLWQAAIEHAETAISAIRDFNGGKVSPSNEAPIWVSRGKAQMALGRMADATETLRLAADVCEANGMLSVAVEARTLLGDIGESQLDPGRAEAEYRSALAQSERMLDVSGGLSEWRIGMASVASAPYKRLADLRLRDGDLAGAFELASRSKGRALQDILSRNDMVLSQGLTESERTEERALLSASKLAFSRLRDVYDNSTDTGARARISREAAEAESRHRSYVDTLMATRPELRERRSPSITLSEAQSLLAGTRKVLLDYTVLNADTILFIVSADHAEAFRLGIGREGLEPAVHRCVSALRQADPATGRPMQSEEQAKTLLGELYGTVLSRAESALVSADTLIVVPDDVLNEVPFHALATPRGYVIERWPVVYMPSPSLLRAAWSGEEASGPPRHPHMLAMACPGGGREPSSAEAVSLVRGTDARLRYADDEATLVPRAAGLSAEVRIEHDATEGAAKALAPGMDYLHFACHFRSDPVAPLESYLRLEPGPGVGEDGQLTARELSGLALKAQLVALPCCSSAGTVASAEGRVGSTWALLAAGSRAALVAEWNIDDASSPRVMETFYHWLGDGNTMAASLRAAQRKLILSKDRSHPYYWASYMLVERGPVHEVTLSPARHSRLALLSFAACVGVLAATLGVARSRRGRMARL